MQELSYDEQIAYQRKVIREEFIKKSEADSVIEHLKTKKEVGKYWN